MYVYKISGILCKLTVRDRPFLVLAAALGGGVPCIRYMVFWISVTVWVGLTVWTATGILSTGFITVGELTGSTVIVVVGVVNVVAAT